MTKRLRKGQDRAGSLDRRRLEFEAVMRQVKKNKQRFIERLDRNLIKEGKCRLYQGSLDHNGYPRMNFRISGKHISIHAIRVFLILKLKKPIPIAHDAAHTKGCTNRRCVEHIKSQHYSLNAAHAH